MIGTVFPSVYGIEGGGKPFAFLHLLVDWRLSEQVGQTAFRSVGEVRDAKSDEAYRAECTRRPFAVEKLEYQMPEGYVVTRWTFKRCLPCDRVEHSVPEFQFCGPRPALFRSEATSDIFDKFKERLADLFTVSLVGRERVLPRDGFFRFIFAGDS